MTAAVPLIAEALNLAITEHWTELSMLALYVNTSDEFSARIETLAVALHARLQEQGTLG